MLGRLTLRPRLLLALAGLLAALLYGLPGVVSAQAYPTRAITLVVPYPPGGASDALARMLADRLKDVLGQPVIVANRPGAGSLIGTQAVIRAPKDGYTLLFTGSALSIQSAINRKFEVDLARDLVPVSEVVSSTFLIATQAAQPFKTVSELVAFAKERPLDLRFGTNGAGTTSFMIFEYLKSLQGVSLLHVPYKGSSEAVLALMSGDVQLVADPVITLHRQVEAGSLRGLAVTGARRSALLPNVPTMQEAGIPNFDITAWIGLLAPGGTPAPIVEQLGRVVAAIMAEPEVVRRVTGLGFDSVGSTSEVFARKLSSEHETWSTLAKERGLQMD